jgi:hypothetical protein
VKKKPHFDYDPNIYWGTKTIRVTLGQWRYRYSVEIEIGGNTRGLALMGDSTLESVWEKLPKE